jgi:hypothetical protein
MPRSASRLTLEITDVRVEKLHEIDDADAMAEGVRFNAGPLRNGHTSALSAFKSLWDSINGKRVPWDSNTWVWVISFRRLEE